MKQTYPDTLVTAGALHERVDGDGQFHPPAATQLPHGSHRPQTGQGDKAVKDKFEFGSREADQAAQKLQSLGAMVYSPGKEGTFDWGILAGPAQPLPACLFVCLSVCLCLSVNPQALPQESSIPRARSLGMVTLPAPEVANSV